MQKIIDTLASSGHTGPRSWTQAATALHRSKATSVRAVDAAGTGRLNMLHTRNTEPWALSPWFKLQASSFKLDRSWDPRYSRSQGQARDGQAIDICGGPLMGPRNSAAEILQGEQHKYPGDHSSRNCRVMVSGTGSGRFKRQAPSSKPKLQAQKFSG